MFTKVRCASIFKPSGFQLFESLRHIVIHYSLNPDYDMFMSRVKFLRKQALKFKHERSLEIIDHVIESLENGDYGICNIPALSSKDYYSIME